MTMVDPTPADERSQRVALTEEALAKGITAQRELRTKIEAEKGQIDTYRITRDVAGNFYQKFSRRQLSVLLAASIDRLAQLPDLELPAELAELDFPTPEAPEEETK